MPDSQRLAWFYLNVLPLLISLDSLNIILMLLSKWFNGCFCLRLLLAGKKWRPIWIFSHSSPRSLWRIILHSISISISLPGVTDCPSIFGLISWGNNSTISKQYLQHLATLRRWWSHLLNINFHLQAI